MDDPFPDGMMECIEAFFVRDDSHRPGQDIYPAVFETSLFFPLQRQRELARMMQIARTVEPRTVFEIGADKGGSLYHWCKCHPTVERVIACEIRGLPYAKVFEQAFPHIEFLWLPCSSFDPLTVNNVTNWLCGWQIDCLFIDGDKSYFDLDFDSYLPLMNKRGIVFFHDVNDPPQTNSPATFAKLRKQYHTECILDISELSLLDQKWHTYDTPYEAWLRHWQGASAGVGVVYLNKELSYV